MGKLLVRSKTRNRKVMKETELIQLFNELDKTKVEKLLKLAIEYPNDNVLGELIRKTIWKLNASN